MNPQYKKLGEQLLLFRKSKYMSQAQMAEKLGVTQAAYGKAERGETNPETYFERIAQVFEIERADIFSSTEGQIINNYGHIEWVNNHLTVTKNTHQDAQLAEIKATLEKLVDIIGDMLQKGR